MPGIFLKRQVDEWVLRADFLDTLDKGSSKSAIALAYNDGTQIRAVIGVPYTIEKDDSNHTILVLGPYFKDVVSNQPEGYEERKVRVPINKILGYRKVELADLLP